LFLLPLPLLPLVTVGGVRRASYFRGGEGWLVVVGVMEYLLSSYGIKFTLNIDAMLE
jgi:hypothetical protein